ncbi:MAG: MlaD family protein [Bacteroidales bacterium]
MMKKFKFSNQLIVGLLFIGALLILIWGFNFLKGQEVLKDRKLVYVTYPKVNGLITSNPVYLNGLQIGQVRSLYFDSNHSGSIVVELLLKDKFPIPRNSKAEIYSTDLLGSKAVKIVLGDSQGLIHNGDTLSSSLQKDLFEEVSTQILPLKNKAEGLIVSLDSMLNVFRSVMNQKTQEDIRQSFRSIRYTLGNLQNSSEDLAEVLSKEKTNISNIISDVSSFTGTLKKNQNNIDTTFINLRAISDTLSQANLSKSLNNVNKALDDFSDILNNVQEGKGSLGKLVTNDSLYNELKLSAENLKLLLDDIKKNPKRYVKFSIF